MTALSRAGPAADSNFDRHAVDEPSERGVDRHADDRIVRAGHADVGEVSRALGQDALVGGLDMRVRADNGGDAAVEMPAHGDFFGCRFGMEVDEDDARLRSQGVDFAQRPANGSSSGVMKTRPIRLSTPTGSPVRVRAEVAAAARHAGGEVRRAKQLRLPSDVVEHFLLVPDVIARRHHVDAVVEDGVGDVAGDAEAGRGVLDVGDHEVDAVALDERGDGAAARSRARAFRRCRR